MEAVTVPLALCASERGERGLAVERGNVSGIYEGEYLALQGITAQNQRGISTGKDSHGNFCGHGDTQYSGKRKLLKEEGERTLIEMS